MKMPSLKLHKNNREATILSIGKKLEVRSYDFKLKSEIKKLVNKFTKSGVVIFTEPEKIKSNEIRIIRRRILPNHPLFLEALGKQLVQIGYKVTYICDKEKILKKELENEVRRILESLSLSQEDQKTRETVSQVLPKMSKEQLEIIKNDLISIKE